VGFSIASSLALGCTCGEDAVVPNHTQTGAPTPPTVLEFAPMEVTLQPAGTTSVTVDEVPITVATGAIAVSGAFDFDRDGDRDVLFVVLEGARVQLLYAERNGSAFVAPSTVAERTESRVVIGNASVVCTPSAAGIQALSMGVAVVTVDATCATQDASRARFVTAWVTPTDTRPRALESFSYLGAASGDGMSFATHDRDQDDHDDLEVTVRAFSGADTVSSTLVWMNRAAGFARQSEQPESSITSLANQAREHIARDPAAALRSAEQTIALRDALCREAERPRFYLGEMAGVPCGTSSAAGRAFAMRAIALVRSLPSDPFSGDLSALARALQTTIALDHDGVAVREGDRALLREAWMRVSSIDPEHFLVSAGPPASIPDGRAPRLSGLAFLDEERVLIRGREPRVLTLATGALEPATSNVETRLQDRGGEHVLVGIERRCEGTVLVIETTAGGARQEVRVDGREGPLTGGCPASLAEGFRSDDAGYRALGWTPQGILLVRGLELTLVPLDANANALGAPQVLSETAPLPAPIPLGAAVADGHAYALAMPFGILVVDRAAHTVSLYRDDNFALPSGEPIDAALSPSGHRAAWFAGGALRWANLERVEAVTTLPAPGPIEVPTQAPPGPPPTPEATPTEPAATAPAATEPTP
jgi:hypothetical protein